MSTLSALLCGTALWALGVALVVLFLRGAADPRGDARPIA